MTSLSQSLMTILQSLKVKKKKKKAKLFIEDCRFFEMYDDYRVYSWLIVLNDVI